MRGAFPADKKKKQAQRAAHTHYPLPAGASAAAEGAATHSDSPCAASLPRSCTRKLPSCASAAGSAHLVRVRARARAGARARARTRAGAWARISRQRPLLVSLDVGAASRPDDGRAVEDLVGVRAKV